MKQHKDISITINRMGNFIVDDLQQHPNQCGKVGVRNYKYKVSVTGSSRYLDAQGFLVDNMVIYHYFIDTYNNKKLKCESCESMVCAAISFIEDYCKNNKVKGIKSIYVQLWGSDHSFIEGEYIIPGPEIKSTFRGKDI